jgi:hypothetical protein
MAGCGWLTGMGSWAAGAWVAAADCKAGALVVYTCVFGLEVAWGVAAAPQAEVIIMISARTKGMAFRFVDISLLLEKNIG